MLEKRSRTNIHDVTTPAESGGACEAVLHASTLVWSALRDAGELGVNLGEESITDAIALDLARSGAQAPRDTFTIRVHTRQVPHAEEHTSGADWEWLVGSDGRWAWYLVQAKKLDPLLNRYLELAHSRAARQIAALRRAAHVARGEPGGGGGPLPLFALYNGSGGGTSAGADAKDRSRYGVTVIPIEPVERARAGPNPLTFELLHGIGDGAVPWSELVCQTPVNPRLRGTLLARLPDRVLAWLSAQSRAPGTGKGDADRAVEDGRDDAVSPYARHVVVMWPPSRTQESDLPEFPQF
jgi:hypothetical protein